RTLMAKIKKIADIIVIGLAIAVVIVLGDRIIKISNNIDKGIYPGQEQEESSAPETHEEKIQTDPGGYTGINFEMVIDDSIFKQRKDFMAAAPKDDEDTIKDASEEVNDNREEISSETVETEESDGSSESTGSMEEGGSIEAASVGSSSDPGNDISVIENIDYSDSTDFRIEVDLSRQILTVFYMEEILKEMVCSGGAPGHATPLGEFTTTQKIKYSWVDRFDVGAYYWIRFFEDYLIHSVPFDKNGKMIVEEFEKLGSPASHGCIRLRLEEAQWLYESLPLGVRVLIY
ncbi:MAG: L,D-transpeptidase, partial [Actinobacteria bacterium]|nr:L,D-transpeptidase [Actinomycetota bacterium]